jgi:hypothetical protein
MKIENYLLYSTILFISLLLSLTTKAQVLDSLISPNLKYESDLTQIIGDKTIKRTFNSKMLHLLFADKIGTSFGGSNDLSLQKYYFGLDNEDKSITIGFNVDSRRGEKLKKLNWIFSGALKLTSSNKFATVIDGEGKFLNDNIGASYKITLIDNGTIDFTSNDEKKRKEAVLYNRDSVLYKKYDAAALKYNKEELDKLKKAYNKRREFDDELVCFDKVLKAKYNTMYEELTQEEIDFIEENKMYNFVSTKWYSLELFTPFGGVTYEITPDENTPYAKDRFYNISATFSRNYMRVYSGGESFFFKSSLNIKNNNTILVNNLSTKTFQTSTAGANNNLILSNTDVYITPYDEFVTTSLTLEPSFFFISNSFGDFGFSPSIEFNIGTYDKINWKLGIPVSLKDIEGKPSINFEFQYKSIKTFEKEVGVFGISSNFLFGDLIN